MFLSKEEDLQLDRGDAMSLPICSGFKKPNDRNHHHQPHQPPASLYSVDETCDADSSECTGTSASTKASRAFSMPLAASTKKVQNKAASQKPERLKLVRILVDDAVNYTDTGEEQRALEAYRQATKIAGSEIARINLKIRKSRRLNEAARASVQNRLREDLGKIGISIGQFRTRMAIIYDRLGDWDEALLCCREALEVYRHQPEIENPSTKVPSSASLIHAMESMIERLESVTSTLHLRDIRMQQMDELRDELQHTTAPEEKQDLYTAIQAQAEEILADEIQALGSFHPQISESLQLLSTVALEQGNQNQAVNYLLKAAEIGMECLGEKHPRIGQYHLRLARIHVSQGMHHPALLNFQQAIRVLFHSPRFSRTLGSTYNDIAAIYISQNEIDLALENLHCALKQFEKVYTLDGDDQEGAATDSLQAHKNIGQCYMKKLNFGRARESFIKVLELQRNSRKVYDSVKDLGLGMVGVEEELVTLIEDEKVAETLVLLGRAYGAEQIHDRALHSFEEALDILKHLELSSQNGRMMERNKLMTRTLFCVGEEASAVGKFDRALEAYKESARLSVLQQTTGPDTALGSVIHHLMCSLGIGNVFALRGDFVAALRIFNKTLKHCRTHNIPPNHPMAQAAREKISNVKKQMVNEAAGCSAGESTTERDNLVRLETESGEYIQSGALDDALEKLKQALRIRRENLAKCKALNGDISSEIEGLANLLECFGLVYAKQGDIENSGRAFSEAYKLRSQYR